jgi:hypothetical protein
VQVAIEPAGEDRARWFYGELLGIEEVSKPESLAGPGGVWFKCFRESDSRNGPVRCGRRHEDVSEGQGKQFGLVGFAEQG